MKVEETARRAREVTNVETGEQGVEVEEEESMDLEAENKKRALVQPTSQASG